MFNNYTNKIRIDAPQARDKHREFMSHYPLTFSHSIDPLDAWKSPRGGVNRANLKFINLSTTTSRVSVRNINESEREGEKQIVSK
jgi:hypothetical protein